MLFYYTMDNNTLHKVVKRKKQEPTLHIYKACEIIKRFYIVVKQ